MPESIIERQLNFKRGIGKNHSGKGSPCGRQGYFPTQSVMSHPMETGNRFRTLDEPTRHLPFQMSENMFCTHGRLNMKNGKPPLFHLFHDFALRQGALHIRKLPQAGKHSLRRTSAKRNPVAAPQQKNSPPFLTPRFLLRLDGKSGSGPIPETEAKLRKRTFRASGSA